jgi:hypothetical protein
VLNATVLLIYGSYWTHLRLCESHSGNNEQSWSIQLVFKVQKWSDECQGCWMLRTNIYQQNIQRCGKNYRSHPRKHRHHHLQLANGLGTSSRTCQSILKPDVNIWQTVIKFVPCVLSDEKKENQVHVCQILQDKLQ